MSKNVDQSNLDENLSTVSHHWVNLILDTAIAKGAQAHDLPIQRTDAQQRYELDHVVTLWEAAVKHTQDQAFGLHVGEHLSPAQLNILGHILLSSQTVLDGFIKAQRYYRLISEGGTIQLDIQGETVRVVYTPLPQNKNFSRHQIESVLSCIFTVIKWMLGQQAQIQGVYFQHPEPQDVSEHQRIFQCPLHFSQTFNAIEGRTSSLSKVINPDDSLTKLHEQMAQKMLDALEQGTWTDRVTQLLEAQMSQHHHEDGDMNMDRIAKQLHITPKTLQRRLHEEHTQFSQVLNQTRLQMAKHYLAQDDLSLDDIAALLGFTEASVFFRAFKRWTGQTPRDFQKQEREISDIQTLHEQVNSNHGK